MLITFKYCIYLLFTLYSIYLVLSFWSNSYETKFAPYLKINSKLYKNEGLINKIFEKSCDTQPVLVIRRNKLI